MRRVYELSSEFTFAAEDRDEAKRFAAGALAEIERVVRNEADFYDDIEIFGQPEGPHGASLLFDAEDEDEDV